MWRVGSLLAVLCVVLAVAAAVGAGGEDSRESTPSAPRTAEPPPAAVDCDQRSEPSPRRFRRRRDITRGPFALIAMRGVDRRPARSFEPRNGRLAGTKFPVAVRAGHDAVVRLAAEDARDAALLVRGATREARSVKDGDVAARYVPCAPDEPRFGGRGEVGPITGWAGALIVSGPRCVTLVVDVDGRRRRDVQLPLGARCD